MRYMRYLKVRWIHDEPEEPGLLSSEVDSEDYERRKADVFFDGRMTAPRRGLESGSTRLGEVPTPAVEVLNRESGFEAQEITELECERIWTPASSC